GRPGSGECRCPRRPQSPAGRAEGRPMTFAGPSARGSSIRRGAGIVLVLALAVVAAIAGRGAEHARALSAVSTCDESHFRAAVTAELAGSSGMVIFECSSGINLTSGAGGTITIPSGKTLIIDGAGQSVILSAGGAFRHFVVAGGGTLEL